MVYTEIVFRQLYKVRYRTGTLCLVTILVRNLDSPKKKLLFIYYIGTGIIHEKAQIDLLNRQNMFIYSAKQLLNLFCCAVEAIQMASKKTT